MRNEKALVFCYFLMLSLLQIGLVQCFICLLLALSASYSYFVNRLAILLIPWDAIFVLSIIYALWSSRLCVHMPPFPPGLRAFAALCVCTNSFWKKFGMQAHWIFAYLCRGWCSSLRLLLQKNVSMVNRLNEHSLYNACIVHTIIGLPAAVRTFL